MSLFHIIHLNQTASTQSFLASLCKKQFVEQYTVVSTFNQTAGRGQGVHTWESQKMKNLSFSLLLRPNFILAQEQFIISKIVCLSITDFLNNYITKDVFIKWPNDIYVKENKICGFLCQNQIIGQNIDSSIIGIGININQTNFLSAPNPTSLALLTNKEYDLNKMLELLLECIEKRYESLQQNIISSKSQAIENINKEYLEKLLFLNQQRPFKIGNQIVKATILGVNEFGHLVLEDDSGKKTTCQMHEIEFILNNTNFAQETKNN